jgi:hypothetical protein
VSRRRGGRWCCWKRDGMSRVVRNLGEEPGVVGEW